MASSLALKRLVGGLFARAYFVTVMRAIPRGDGPEGESLLQGFLHRLPARLLGWSGRASQGVANRLPGTTSDLAVYPFGAEVFLFSWFQGVQEYPLSLVKVAVGVIVKHGLEFRAGRVRIGRSPQ